MINDLRFALRTLIKSPGFTGIAVAALALGIGANTAIFSVINSVLLQPLPYHQPNELAEVYCNIPAKGLADMGFAYADFLEVQAQNRSFSSMAAYFSRNVNLAGADRPERVQGARISANLFDVLGIQPLVGRSFRPEDEAWGQHRVAILSHKFWIQHFAGRREVVGQNVLFSGTPYTVVGVMPLGAYFPDQDTVVWTPISFAPKDDMAGRSNHYINAIGRLRSGVTLSQSRADVQTVGKRVEAQFPENAGIGMDARDYMTTIVGEVKPALWILMGAVGFVLFIACANVANLLLARAAGRQREMTLRAALGASGLRLVRLTLVESGVLATLGGVLGLLLARWLLDGIRAMAATSVPRMESVSIDWRVLLFTAVLALGSSLIFGLMPAVSARRVDLADALKEGSRATGGSSRSRARSVLVVAEVALSLVLLTGAGLLVESLIKLQRVQPGFDADRVISMMVPLPAGQYPKPEAKSAFHRQALERVASIPGVQATGASSTIPLANWGGWGKYLTVEGREAGKLADVASVNYRQVTPDYFRALGVPLRSGRFFDSSDAAGRAPVAIVNETLARKYWPNENPIGKRLWAGPPEHLLGSQATPGFQFPRCTIVGVIADVRHSGLNKPPQEELYIPHDQGGDEVVSVMYLVARTAGDPKALVSSIHSVIREIDRNQPIADVKTMEERLNDSLAGRRFNLLLLGGFAALALLLASIGIYGVMSYAVSQRTSEIGVRVALGASARDVLGMVVGHGLQLTLAGLLIGAAAALALTRLMSTMLYEVKATEPVVFLLAPAILLLIAAIACYVPAYRATRIDPIRALRYE